MVDKTNNNIKINTKINNHKNKRNILESLFKTMLHQLMTGQKRVKDLEIATYFFNIA